MRATVAVPSRPMGFQVRPASVDLKTPSPAVEARKMLASPVPTQTTSGSDPATARSPTDRVGMSSKTGSQVVPAFTVLKTPPVAAAA